MSRKLLVVLIVSALLVLAGVAAYVGLKVFGQNPPIPTSIEKRLTFSPFIVTNDRSGALKVGSYKYDSQSQLLSFVITDTSANHVFTISEQASPPSFSEVPDLYSKLVNGLNGYDTIETFNGSVDLTRPNDSEQTAIMNERGVLLFAKSGNGDVSNTAWKDLIESLDIYKLN